MDYLFNSYYIDGYNQLALLGKTIIKYAEDKGVEKLNNYLSKFKYDFFVEYGEASSGEGLNIRLGSGQKSIFFKRKIFSMQGAFFQSLREIRFLQICYHRLSEL